MKFLGCFFQPRYIGSQKRFAKNEHARDAQVKGEEKKGLFFGSFGKRCFDFFSVLFSKLFQQGGH